MRLPSIVPFALTSLLAGCGGSASPTSAGSSGQEPPTHTTKQAVCDIHSGYPGDEYCLAPPDPSEGIQIHVGPPSYDDPDAVAPFLVGVGKENVACFNAAIPDSDFYYLHQVNHMRTGSHHMLITVQNNTALQTGPSTACDITGGVAAIPGSQTPTHEFPDQLGPEDEGIGRYLPQSNMASFQLHYINTGSVPVLREAWVNLYKKPESEVTQRLQSVFMVGDFGVNVPPHTEQTTTLAFTPTLPSETRVFELNAHIHAHTQAFTVWKVHGGQEDVIYQSFNWEDPLEDTYNSVVKNPAPDPVAAKDGGLSGLLFLEPGDSLKWACDVNNTLDTPLRFANEALTAEMCMLVGSYISPTPGLLAGGCFNGTCGAGLGVGPKKQ